MSERIEMPGMLEHYTADEVAETLDYGKHLEEGRSKALYQFLWRTLEESKNPTPLGGDGSNGTVETPGERMSLDNDDKAGHWWDRLDRDWQEAIAKAIEEAYS